MLGWVNQARGPSPAARQARVPSATAKQTRGLTRLGDQALRLGRLGDQALRLGRLEGRALRLGRLERQFHSILNQSQKSMPTPGSREREGGIMAKWLQRICKIVKWGHGKFWVHESLPIDNDYFCIFSH